MSIKPILNLYIPSRFHKINNSKFSPSSEVFNEFSKYFTLNIYCDIDIVSEKIKLNQNQLNSNINLISFFKDNKIIKGKKIQKNKDELYMIFYPFHSLSWYLAYKLKNQKLVIWVRTDHRDHSLKRYNYKDYRKYLYFILKPIHYVAYTLVSKYLFKNKLIFYTANATINPKNHLNQHEIISNSTVNKDPKLIKSYTSNKIFFVGGENRRKGLALLLKALQHSNKELHIIGLDSLKDTEHVKLAKQVNIKIHGKIYYDRDKYYKLLSQADIVVMPSYGEKQGKIQLEAMSVGVVPICSDSGGTYQTIHNYYNGLLFKEGDWKDLKQKIELMYSDKKLYKNIKENGLEYIKTQSVEKQIKLM
ncbi:MAG: glycosyltransferase, partial [Candidatus Woesearchaeota archaeon]